MTTALGVTNRTVVEALGQELTGLDELDEAWATRSAGPRLRAVQAGARKLRRRLLEGEPVRCAWALPLARFPYPARFALGGAQWHPAPLVEMNHRALLVEFLQRGVPKRLLFNPTDVEAARATPFFAQLLARIPAWLQPWVVAKPLPPLERQLADLGVEAEQIDYVAFDHFHTQDLRALFGRFPRARLLAPRREWEAWSDVHPVQRAWYVPEGSQAPCFAQMYPSSELTPSPLAPGLRPTFEHGPLRIGAPGEVRR